MDSLQRIRYTKVGPLLRSFRKFTVGDQEFLLEINPLTKTAYLLNAKDNSIVKQAHTNASLHKLKIAARKLLEETGLSTSKENRLGRIEKLENGT